MNAGTKFAIGAGLIVASVGYLMASGVKETGQYFLTPTELTQKVALDPSFYNVGMRVGAHVVRPDLVRRGVVRAHLVRPDLVRPDLVGDHLVGDHLVGRRLGSLTPARPPLSLSSARLPSSPARRRAWHLRQPAN